MPADCAANIYLQIGLASRTNRGASEKTADRNQRLALNFQLTSATAGFTQARVRMAATASLWLSLASRYT